MKGILVFHFIVFFLREPFEFFGELGVLKICPFLSWILGLFLIDW